MTIQGTTGGFLPFLRQAGAAASAEGFKSYYEMLRADAEFLFRLPLAGAFVHTGRRVHVRFIESLWFRMVSTWFPIVSHGFP